MFICLDIETTGLNPLGDHVIEVAILRFDHEKILDEWSSLVNPGVPVPEFVSRLTGITTEMLKGAPKLADIAEVIKEKIGELPIMGHYIFFDINFLGEKNIALPNTQLDTCQFAQTFLIDEASYSLEVLAEKLGIVQKDAHRATDDCRANIELFWQLSSHVKSLSKEEKEKIRPVLQKSTWSWAQHILELLSQDGGKKISNQKTESMALSEKHADLTGLTKDLQTPFLFEEASHTYQDLIDYALNLEGQTLLVVPKIFQLPQHKDLGVIKDPNQYVDEDRLAAFLAQESLDETKTMLGIKTILLLTESESGDKAGMRLVKQEKQIWPDICCQSPKSFFKRAEELAFKKKIIATGTSHFLTDRSRKKPDMNIPENLVISGAEVVLKTVEFAWHIILSESRFLNDIRRLKEDNPVSAEVLDNLANKISILFGLLGMILQKNGDANDPWNSLSIEPFHRNTSEWNNIKKSAASLEPALTALNDSVQSSPGRDEFERYLTYLNGILQTDSSVIWITSGMDGQILLHSFPENPSKIFKERVWKDIKKLHIFCHHGDLSDDFKFIKTELGLPEEITTASSKEIYPLPLIEPQTKLSSPNHPNNIKEVTHELSLHVPSAKGNIFLLVTSKNSAEQFFYSLNKIVEETARKLFVQNLSGGLGKIFKLAQKTDGKNIFVGNEGLLEFLLNEGVNLNLLAIHRLPFSPPNSPTQKVYAKKYTDAYKEFVLPQVAIRFRSILNDFLGNKWGDKKIIVLDPRNKEYEELLY